VCVSDSDHDGLGILNPRQRDASDGVEKSVQCVTAFRQRQHVAAHDVGERVVQAPEVALFRPLRVFGVVPLVENVRECGLAHCATAVSLGDEVVRLNVLEHARLISLDALGVVAPSVEQLAEGPSEEVRKVAQDELGVTTSDFDLVVKREVVADERRGTSVDASGKRLVVRVTQADHSPDVGLL
jgi:hypothetical protein